MQRFFKTGPGEYGEGDVFIGIRVPELRRAARAHASASTATCRRLLASSIHEHRFVALAILCRQYERGDAIDRERIEDLYLECRDRVNNWDLVDASAPYLLADRVARRRASCSTRWSRQSRSGTAGSPCSRPSR